MNARQKVVSIRICLFPFGVILLESQIGGVGPPLAKMLVNQK